MEIKPCTKCGEKRIRIKTEQREFWKVYRVICINCGNEGRSASSHNEAIDIWNLRLKPCPFCGSSDVRKMVMESDYSPDEYYCYCDDCGAQTAIHKTEQEAIDSWENRVAT